MRRSSVLLSILLMAFLAAVPGCSWWKKSQPRPKPAPAVPMADTMISIDASSYSLKPDRVRLAKPGEFILQVNNATGSEQEFIVKDPKGKELKAFHVGAKATSISNVELPSPGIYELRSTNLLRLPMGKTVRIEVGQAK